MIHPEVLPLINQEFKRLSMNHPDLDGSVLWHMANEYVNAICYADTEMIKHVYLTDVIKGY